MNEKEPRQNLGLSPKALLLATFGFSGIAVWFTWPLATRLTTALAGDVGDGATFLWSMWWFRHQVLLGENPYLCDIIHAPFGVNLAFHDYAEYRGILGLLLIPILGLVGAHNFIMLIGMVLSGLFFMLLARQFSIDNWSAFAGAVFFSFCSYRAARLLGHFALTEIQWFPLTLLALMLLRRTGSMGAFLLLGVSLGLQGLTTPYYIIYSLFLIPLYLLGEFIDGCLNRGSRSILGVARSLYPGTAAGFVGGIGIVTACVVVAQGPKVAMGFREYASYAGSLVYDEHAAVTYALRLRNYVSTTYQSGKPDFLSPLWPISDSIRVQGMEGHAGLGLVAIGLALVGAVLWHRSRLPSYVSLVFGFFFLFSLGKAGGLHTLIMHLPVVRGARVPSRAGVVALLAVSLFAAYALHRLGDWLAQRGWGGLRAPVALASALLHLALFPSEAMAMREWRVPEPVRVLAEKDEGLLLVLPLGISMYSVPSNFARGLALQSVHQRPMVTGYIGRWQWEHILLMEGTPLFEPLMVPIHREFTLPDDPQYYLEAYRISEGLGLRWILARTAERYPGNSKEVAARFLDRLYEVRELSREPEFQELVLLEIVGPGPKVREALGLEQGGQDTAP